MDLIDDCSALLRARFKLPRPGEAAEVNHAVVEPRFIEFPAGLDDFVGLIPLIDRFEYLIIPALDPNHEVIKAARLDPPDIVHRLVSEIRDDRVGGEAGFRVIALDELPHPDLLFR